MPPVVVSSLNLPQNVDETLYNGIIMDISGSLSNPSIITLKMGAISMKVYYKGTRQADMEINNLNLIPGVNSFPASGILNPSQSDLGMTGKFFTAYLSGLPSPVTLTLDTKYPASTAPWLRQVLQNTTLTSNLQSPTSFNLIGPIKINGQINVQFLPSTTQFAGIVQTNYNSPFGFNLTILQYTMIMTLSQNSSIFGNLKVDWVDANQTSEGAILLPFTGDLNVTNRDSFVSFIKNTLTQPSKMISISCIASVKTKTGAGIVQIDNVLTSSDIPIIGFNSFNKTLTINSIAVNGGIDQLLQFTASSTIISNSTISAILNEMVFDISSQGINVGTVTGTSITLNGSPTGVSNNVSLSGTFNQTLGSNSKSKISQILSKYIARIFPLSFPFSFFFFF